MPVSPDGGIDRKLSKAKKKGELCGCEWITCPVNIILQYRTELHMRGSVFGTGK
jgi:hypothetical protein